MSLNPFDSTLNELRDMNEALLKTLNKIVIKLDRLIEQNDEMMDFVTRNHGH